MNESQTRKADFLASILLVAFSALVILTALAMPRYQQGWYAAPGFPPLFFGILLLVLSLAFLIRSALAGGWKIRLGAEHWKRFKASRAVRRVAVMSGFIAGFLLLFGKIPFIVLSAVFLFGTIWYYRGAKLWMNALVSLVASFAIWYVFSVVFMVPLP